MDGVDSSVGPIRRAGEVEGVGGAVGGGGGLFTMGMMFVAARDN